MSRKTAVLYPDLDGIGAAGLDSAAGIQCAPGGGRGNRLTAAAQLGGTDPWSSGDNNSSSGIDRNRVAEIVTFHGD